jgi:uncharacterized protein YcnI
MKRFFVLAAVCAAPLAHAHVTVDPRQAPAGAWQRLAFRVGHGCEGSATTAITVQIPDGVIGAKPMPKPGWTITTTEGKLATPVQSHGKPVTTRVAEISWRGGPLPDAWYDEFVMQVKLPDAPGRYAFKVGQACEKGRVDWVEIPAPGAHADAPAPVLEVLAPENGMSGMPGMAHHH